MTEEEAQKLLKETGDGNTVIRILIFTAAILAVCGIAYFLTR